MRNGICWVLVAVDQSKDRAEYQDAKQLMELSRPYQLGPAHVRFADICIMALATSLLHAAKCTWPNSPVVHPDRSKPQGRNP